MKNLVCLVFMVLLPLTLASETQHRFKVYVYVGGKDETTTNLISSYLKRELRTLGNVDVIGYLDDWRYRLDVVYVEILTKDGANTGKLAIASMMQKKVEKFYLKDNFSNIKVVFPGHLGASYWNRDDLQEWCISEVADFNGRYLKSK